MNTCDGNFFSRNEVTDGLIMLIFYTNVFGTQIPHMIFSEYRSSDAVAVNGGGNRGEEMESGKQVSEEGGFATGFM